MKTTHSTHLNMRFSRIIDQRYNYTIDQQNTINTIVALITHLDQHTAQNLLCDFSNK